MSKRALVISLSFVLMAGCASRMPLANTLTEGAELEASEVDQLAWGRTVAITQCFSCHRQFWPDEYSPREWRPLAKRMGQRAFLSKSEESALRAYMATASRHVLLAGAASQLPAVADISGDAEVSEQDAAQLEEGRTVAILSCANCHRQYWPDEYGPKQWKPIVRSMAKKAVLSESETAALLAYLTTAAKHARGATE